MISLKSKKYGWSSDTGSSNETTVADELQKVYMYVSNQTDRFMLRITLLHTIFGLAACHKFTGKVTGNFKPSEITQKIDRKKKKCHKTNRL